MTAEQPEAEQRERLLRAMTDTVAERGYSSSTIKEVVERAGVSRNVFYEHFADKRECFLAAYDATLARHRDAAASAYDMDGDVVERAQAVLRALFDVATADPGGVHLVTVEVGAVGEAGFERREALFTGFEGLLRGSLSLTPRLSTVPNPVLRAVVGGLTRVVYARVQSGKQAELLKLVPDLVRWASAYAQRSPMFAFRDPSPSMPSDATGLWGGRAPGTLSSLGAGANGANGSRRLAPPKQGVADSFHVHSQRERIVDAVANIAARSGYAGLTVKGIGEESGIAPSSFRQHFSGKEEAFLVAYELGHAKGLAVVERAFSAESDWRLGVRAGVSALFDFLASEPAFAQMALVESMIATRRSAERSRRGVSGYAKMLEPGLRAAPEESRPPGVAIEAISGGIFELCMTYTLKGRVHELSELVPRATFFALTPFLGAEEAAAIATEPAL
jgi:AcrR family transcriptional regulator